MEGEITKIQQVQTREAGVRGGGKCQILVILRLNVPESERPRMKERAIRREKELEENV